MKKPLSYKQRLMLAVRRQDAEHRAATLETGVSIPYGFQSYAIVTAKLQNKRLNNDWR